MNEKRRNARFGHAGPFAKMGWLLWFVGVIVIGPVIWVVIYRYVNPPVTLNMMFAADKHIERSWVPLAKISPNLIDAAIASEDANFCTHHGFDANAIREAWKSNQQGKRLRGASTISMQTAKNAFLWADRTWLRKGLEAYFTFLMELFWPKQRIMEVYLNIVEWGDSLYGAQAASEHYFHTAAGNLSAGQAARLVAVLPNPRHWSALSDTPIVYYRALTIEEREDRIRVDGKARCVTPHASGN